jgi:hypothetical protein
MNWIRESRPPPIQPSSTGGSAVAVKVTPIGEELGRRYRRVDEAFVNQTLSASLLPTYHADTVWGNVYCQHFTVGLASYHFVRPPSSESGQDGLVYIFYEHGKVSQWPLLDNSQPIPARVAFRNISFPDPFTFRGQICWWQDYGTTCQGMARWEYEMKFDRQFICIVSGTVNCASRNETDVKEMSQYGSSLIYCNAALYSLFVSQVTALAANTNRDDNPVFNIVPL